MEGSAFDGVIREVSSSRDLDSGGGQSYPVMDQSRDITLAQVPRRASRWPARLDLAQSLSGLALAVFMWGHMLFVSSIHVSEELMWTVTRFFEGYFIFGKPYPIVVSFVVAIIFALFITHALLALRKFPADYRQYRAFLVHSQALKHTDTHLWAVQVVTGFALFFLASPHLVQMLTQPGNIGPYASSDRVWSGSWWPIYLLLLFCVEVHGSIGLYRLMAKWGWFMGRGDPALARRRLRRLWLGLAAFLIVLGMLTLSSYMKIGYEHRSRVGERYVPPSSAVMP